MLRNVTEIGIIDERSRQNQPLRAFFVTQLYINSVLTQKASDGGQPPQDGPKPSVLLGRLWKNLGKLWKTEKTLGKYWGMLGGKRA